MNADFRDRIIQEHAPVVMAPSFAALEPLYANGHRYVAARSGLFLEVRRPWLHLQWPLHEQGAINPALPYGEIAQRFSVAFGKLPKDLLRRFLADAQASAPFEHAAWLVWDSIAHELVYRDVDIQEFSAGGIRYNRPALPDHESLAVDLHSHGEVPAFFSSTDNEDDAGEVKIAGVVGNLKQGEPPVWALRLCVLGLYIDLPGPKEL